MKISSVLLHYTASTYVPPKWANQLLFIPKHRLKLAMLPTPITKWNLPGIKSNMEVFIKRDDMTGCSLSGNKIRKLEFIFAEALVNGCSTVITCGGVQSNHCRTTVVAAKELGLDCHLFLRSNTKEKELINSPGNLLLDMFVGSKLHFIPKAAKYETEIRPLQESLQDIIRVCQGGIVCNRRRDQ